LDSVPILLGIIKELCFEDFILEGDIGHILVCLFEEVSTGRGKVDEVEIEKRANHKENHQSGNLKKFNDTIITFIFADDSRIDLIYLARNKSECSHTPCRNKNYILSIILNLALLAALLAATSL